MMKKFSALLSFLILFTAFTCENEPLEGDFVNDDGSTSSISCADASQNLVTATTNFAGVAPDDPNYTQLCLVYTGALEDQIVACGDDGTIQSIIDSLGTCGDNDLTAECEAATIVASQAETAYNNDNTNEDLCNTYKNAMQNKITTCGDADGSIQDIIDELGDCSIMSSGDGSITVTAGTLALEFDEITVVVENNVVKVSGETSASNDYSIYFEVNEGVTGADAMQNFQISLISVFYASTMDAPFDFISNIETNAIGSLTGTFSNIVVNDDNGQLSLTSGTINVSY